MLPIVRCHYVHALLIVRCHCVACCASERAIVCKIYYVKVRSCGYIAHCMVLWDVIAWFPPVSTFPYHGAILCLCSPFQSAIVCLCTPCQGAFVWLRCPLHCATGSYRMVPPCAKFPISWNYCVPMLVANHLCANRAQSFPSQGAIALQVAHFKVLSYAYVAHCMPMLPNDWCHHVTSCLCHGGHCVLSCPSCGTVV